MKPPYFEREPVWRKLIPDHDVIGSLTSRQQDVVRRVAGGDSNKQIARSLRITDQSVKNILTRAYKGLGVSNRLGATNVFLQNGEKVGAENAVNSAKGVPLSPREAEVLSLLVYNDTGGITNKGIARRLSISHSTVSNHLKSAYKKLGVSNRVEAVMRFRGVITPQDESIDALI